MGVIELYPPLGFVEPKGESASTMNQSRKEENLSVQLQEKSINDFLRQCNFPGVGAESGGWCEQATTVSLTTLFLFTNEVQLLQYKITH